MSLLVIDGPTTDRINQVREFAEKNFLTREYMIKSHTPGGVTKEEIAQFEVRAHVGWLICYTVEEQRINGRSVKMRHISIENERTQKLPHPTIIQQIMDAYGFVNELTKCKVFFTNEDTRINVMEIFEPVSSANI
jgi:hypothetical protein